MRAKGPTLSIARSASGGNVRIGSPSATKVKKWLPWMLLLFSFLPFIKDEALVTHRERQSGPPDDHSQGFMSPIDRHADDFTSNISLVAGGEAANATNTEAMRPPPVSHTDLQMEEEDEELDFLGNKVVKQPTPEEKAAIEAQRLQVNLEALAKGKEIRGTRAEAKSAARVRQEQLLKIKQAVDAAEKRLCKPVQVRGEGWHMMCSEKAYHQIRAEKKKLMEELEQVSKEKEKERQRSVQEDTFKTVAGSAHLWKQMMGVANPGDKHPQPRQTRAQTREPIPRPQHTQEQTREPARDHPRKPSLHPRVESEPTPSLTAGGQTEEAGVDDMASGV
eukprot:CAMPEP_0118949228 /NCGR_PEP_ID=MMETSP1169-20130426/49254_1 /TAXON_ID=36882 /ORGANISM="Pyramimonas obovata, Strain CCMP722" /LENGTH=333 /DNA_ID=CAMNT_0006895815 /DNA_START=434 /DNA_END=1431 /DNA_ORIENTATION=-